MTGSLSGKVVLITGAVDAALDAGVPGAGHHPVHVVPEGKVDRHEGGGEREDEDHAAVVVLI